MSARYGPSWPTHWEGREGWTLCGALVSAPGMSAATRCRQAAGAARL